MKKFFPAMLIFFIMVNMAGCTTLQKKFTRKKKVEKRMPKIYQVRKYEAKPTPELYKKHFSYWASWQSELIKVLGANRKKDKRCAEEIVGNLNDIYNMLAKEKADELKPHIDRMVGVKDMIFNEELTQGSKDFVRMTLEREDRFIKREFVFDKVKNYLKDNFDDEPVE